METPFVKTLVVLAELWKRKLFDQNVPKIGCTRRGSYSAKGVFLPSKRLLSAFENTPLLRNPSKNLCLY